MATFSVVSCGFAPARLAAHPAHQQVRELPDPTAPEFLSFGRALIEQLPKDQPILLVHGGRREQSRKVGVLRALSRGTSVVGVSQRVPPTGLAARATWLATLADRRVPASLAIGHLERHGTVLPTVAAISSAAGLDVPGVKLRHHAMSWIPTVCFGVSIASGVKIANGNPGVDFPDEPMDRVVDGTPSFESKVNFHSPQANETVELPSVAPEAKWWGRARYYEQTFVPRDILNTLRLISNERFGRCPQCGGVASGSCPFCSAREEVAV